MKRDVLRMMVFGFTLLALGFTAAGQLLLGEVAASDEVPDLNACQSEFDTCKARADTKKKKNKCKKKRDKCACTYECASRRAAAIEEACEAATQRTSERSCQNVDPSDIPRECGSVDVCVANRDPECYERLNDCAVASCERQMTNECVAEQTDQCIADCLAEE